MRYHSNLRKCGASGCGVLGTSLCLILWLASCSLSEGFVFKMGFSVLLCLEESSSLLELLQTEVNLSLLQCSIGKLQ